MKYLSAKAIKARLTTVKAWQLEKQHSTFAPEHVWTNPDMDPVPEKEQTWSMWTWMGYWCSDCINAGTWELASSIVAVGLTWRDALPVIAVGCVCIAIPMVLNGAIGAKYHIPFSVISRASFGYYLAYFCIVSRAVLAMFWLGINTMNGSYCVTVMLGSWTSKYNDIPNRLPSSAGITTMGMCSYFVFWAIQTPFLLIPPTKLQWLFMAKLILTPITALATLGWCVHRARHVEGLYDTKPTIHGSAYAYQWLAAMTSISGSWSTLACNIPDFSRYAKSSRAQYIQFPFLPFLFTLCGALGVVTATSTKGIWPEDGYLWNPLDICAKWNQMGSGGRAAAFFASLSWMIAQIGTNVTANSISAANDLTVLFPRYMNIHRGCIVAALVGGWVVVPWKILASAETFLSFMGAYAVFLAPIAGIMCSDYWLIRNCTLDVKSLYDPRGRYRYTGGVNWRAVVAFLVPVVPLLPGLGNAVSGIKINAGLTHLYSFNWLFGFVTSIALYVPLSKFFPDETSLMAPPDAIDGVDIVPPTGITLPITEKGALENICQK